MLRLLNDGDLPTLHEFLRKHAATSMFLRSNLLRAGIDNTAEDRLGGAYAGYFREQDLAGVVAHFGNQMLSIQTDQYHGQLARLAMETTGLELAGMTGKLEQVRTTCEALELDETRRKLDSQELLYDLDRQELQVPRLLERPEVTHRPPERRDLELLVEWFTAYYSETLGGDMQQARQSVERYLAAGTARVLEVEGTPVAYCHFNATTPDTVQIGGVWTPPEFRSRGYGRAVVAAHIETAPPSVEKIILFTACTNIAAQRAYEALGFRHIGEFAVVLFERKPPDSPETP